MVPTRVDRRISNVAETPRNYGLDHAETIDQPRPTVLYVEEMLERDHLKVRVRDDFVLDAGTFEAISGPDGRELLIRPPTTTLFRQVLNFLEAQPDPPRPLSGSMIGREGVAAAALTLRWGSYLAVLCDRDKPVWNEVSSANTSRISDEEMARINIEASAALAEWVDLYRDSSGGQRYQQLVNRAVFHLPMPKKTSTVEAGLVRDAGQARDRGGAH